MRRHRSRRHDNETKSCKVNGSKGRVIRSRDRLRRQSHIGDLQNSAPYVLGSVNPALGLSNSMTQNECEINGHVNNNSADQTAVIPPRHCNHISELTVASNHDEATSNNTLIDKLKQILQSVTTVNPQNKEKFPTVNVVPEFDPKVKNQTIVTWLNKVNECAVIYGWDGKQTAHYALPKLMGTAKRWYEGQPSVMHTWEVWQVKLKSAFPVYESYGRLLTEMLSIRAKFGEDLEEYFYEKLIALNRCGIEGKNAIDCIVFGIDDRSVRYGAEAVGFEDTDKLLGYLRNTKHEKFEKNRKIVRSSSEFNRKPVKVEYNRPIKCFNCHDSGHTFNNCKKPIIKCQKCWRIGHNDPSCPREVYIDKQEIKSL